MSGDVAAKDGPSSLSGANSCLTGREQVLGNERGGGRVVDHVRVARVRERGTEAVPSAVGGVPLLVLPPSKRTHVRGWL